MESGPADVGPPTIGSALALTSWTSTGLSAVPACAEATCACVNDEALLATTSPARTGSARSAKRNLIMFPPGVRRAAWRLPARRATFDTTDSDFPMAAQFAPRFVPASSLQSWRHVPAAARALD